jgi:two-component system chemotaxis response regulator CheY
MKRVLDVGQCGVDHVAIRRLIEGEFQAQVVQAHDLAGALEQLRAGSFDLVLVNRKLDADYTDGMAVLSAIKLDEKLTGVPVMLVSNYADAQAEAEAAGAAPGFGKAELGAAETRERLGKFLK